MPDVGLTLPNGPEPFDLEDALAPPPLRSRPPTGPRLPRPRAGEAQRGIHGRARLGVGIALASATIAVVTTMRTRAAVLPRAGGAPPLASSVGFDPHEARPLSRFAYGCERFPSLTPDGREVLFAGGSDADQHVYALDLGTGAQRQITHGAGLQYAPSVSPDGRSVAFVRRRGEAYSAALLPLATSEGAPGMEREIAPGRVRPRWSPDGRAVWVGDELAQRVEVASGAVTRALPSLAGLVPNTRAKSSPTAEGWPSWPRGARDATPDRARLLWAGGHPADLARARAASTRSLALAARWGARDRRRRIDADDARALWSVPLERYPPTVLASKATQVSTGLALSASGDRAVWSDCRVRAQLTVMSPAPEGGFSTKALFAALGMVGRSVERRAGDGDARGPLRPLRRDAPVDARQRRGGRANDPDTRRDPRRSGRLR